MKVQELIELLGRCDAEAEVVITGQPNWPIEHTIAGIAMREDCHRESGARRYESGTTPRDVLLVEGAWLRYGERAAWGVARARSR